MQRFGGGSGESHAAPRHWGNHLLVIRYPLSSPLGPSLLLSTGMSILPGLGSSLPLTAESFLHSRFPPPPPVDRTYQPGHTPLKDAYLLPYLLFFFQFFNVLFISETERDRAWTGEGQREWETQNPKQAPGSELSAQSPMWGSNSQTPRSWPELKSDAQPTEPPRRPNPLFTFSLPSRTSRIIRLKPAQWPVFSYVNSLFYFHFLFLTSLSHSLSLTFEDEEVKTVILHSHCLFSDPV